MLGWAGSHFLRQAGSSSLLKLLTLLTGALLGAALAPLGSTSIAVAIPLISEEIGVNPTLITQMLVGGYLFICIVGQGPGGKLVDSIGSVRTLYLGLSIFLMGTVLGYMVADVLLLTISRMAMALGTAFITPATQALLRRRMPSHMLAHSFGIYGSTMGAAAALGPWIGALIIQSGHWSWVFALNIPVALLSGFLIGCVVFFDRSEDAVTSPGDFDYMGVIWLGAAVICLQAAVSLHGPVLWGLVLLAPVFVGLLVRHINLHANPVFLPELFQNRVYTLCCIVNALNNLVMYSLLFQIPILLFAVWGLSPVVAGSILLPLTLGMMVIGPAAGFLINHFGPRIALSVGQIALTAGLIALYWAMASNVDYILIPGLLACGMGVGMTMPCVQVTGMAVIASRLSGNASASLNTWRYLGGAAGIALMTLILAEVEGNVSRHQLVLVIYGTAAALMFMVALLLPRQLTIAE